MILSMTCWGFSWTSGKILSHYAGPLTISFFRFALTFVSLLLILWLAKQKLSLDKSGFRDLILASLLISLYTYLFFKGLTVGKAGAGGILVTVLNPIISYCLTLGIARRKPTRQEFYGLSLGVLAGLILLKIFTDASALWSAGNVYFLLASFSWALLSLVTARASRYGSPPAFSCWMYGVSTIVMFALSGPSASVVLIDHADATFWGNLFFSATITTSLATTFYFIATVKIGASKASSFIFLVPFSAALGSWIFLNEVPQLHSIVGGLLGIAAVYILNMKKRVAST
ncbi:DMT family transporter [Chryseolinea sp. Jin1]|uniref:DMT family transporter n=2 Tax=Chryseolinea lacunae TaxID=2801331 RepID=A0ABS1KN74_9BACT|nr:DMT family transporter [Chryseolinea lacunae]